MSRPRVRSAPPGSVGSGLDRIREELGLTAGFSAAVIAEADRAAAGARDTRATTGRRDATDLPMVTLDPASATDLDQAFAITSDGDDVVLHYAIADLSAFVRRGGALERAVWDRGVTVYLPDGKVPLHPPVLSEAAASLLPDGPRPAVLLTVAVGPDGEAVLRSAERAVVCSRAKLAYESATPADLPPGLGLLAERVRDAERERGATRIDSPEQEVVEDATVPGAFRLRFRPRRPAEDDNAAMSLAANLAVADALHDAGTGLFRVMDGPGDEDVTRLRRTAAGLGVPWPVEMSLGDLERSLDPARDDHAMLVLAIRRAGGLAGYRPYVEGRPAWHAAVAATYAHATAPLRRLADRYVLDAVVAVCGGGEVGEDHDDVFEELPAVMQRAESRAAAADRAVVDLVESVVLQPCVGQVVEGVVLEVSPGSARVQLPEHAVVSKVEDLPAAVGDRVRLLVAVADPAERRVVLEPVRPGRA